MIVIIDYDTGNLCSLENALKRLNCEYTVSSNPAVIAGAGKVILPGVGEASTAMYKLVERGLVDVIKSLTQPTLGICIGFHLMCRSSEEGNAACLCIFDTTVKRFAAAGIKIPHIGWNSIERLSSPLFRGIEEGSYVYYVHSFAPQAGSATVAMTDYGGNFSAAIASGNFFGVQFHPEKSGNVGERILNNFLAI